MEPVTPTDLAMQRIADEYDMPAIDVIRHEAYAANYPLLWVARDLGMSEFMLRRVMRKYDIEWNRDKKPEPQDDMPSYAVHVVEL